MKSAGREETPEAAESREDMNMNMNAVQRNKSFRQVVRKALLRSPERKYTTAGDRACGAMMRDARRRRRSRPDPEMDAIHTWAMLELRREIREGFWNPVPARAA